MCFFVGAVVDLYIFCEYRIVTDLITFSEFINGLYDLSLLFSFLPFGRPKYMFVMDKLFVY